MNLEDKEKWQNQIGSVGKRLKNKINAIWDLLEAIVVFFAILYLQIVYIITGKE